MDLRIRDIIERLRMIWRRGAINVSVDYWQYRPDEKITLKCSFWIGTIDCSFRLKSIDEIEQWLIRKELLFKKF